jgi:heme/copper-type cytochrome/quinol oxidase subunit 4
MPCLALARALATQRPLPLMQNERGTVKKWRHAFALVVINLLARVVAIFVVLLMFIHIQQSNANVTLPGGMMMTTVPLIALRWLDAINVLAQRG